MTSPMERRCPSGEEAFDGVAHVAEAAGLFAVAVDADDGVVPAQDLTKMGRTIP